jgi:cell division protein FtsB
VKEAAERPDQPAGEEKTAAGGGPLAWLLSAVPRLLGNRFTLLTIALIGAAALIYLAASADGFLKSQELAREKARLEADIELLKDENRLLRLKIESFNNNPAYVEDEGRKKLRLIRPEETIYRLSEEPDLGDLPPQKPPHQ